MTKEPARRRGSKDPADAVEPPTAAETTTETAPSGEKPFLGTLPGLITAFAALITAIGGILALFVTGGGPTVRRDVPTATPPNPTTLFVAATVPADGAQDVDPKLTAITIVFNQAINQDQWSFTETESWPVPEVTGDPSFPDARTCVLPVKLAPNTTYGLGINSAQHQNFVSATDPDLVAEPHTLVFTTGP